MNVVVRSAVVGVALGLAASACVPEVTLAPERDAGEQQGDAALGCLAGETRSGTHGCGINEAGRLEELCSAGAWVETTTCADPDQCKNWSARGSCSVDGSAEACRDGRWIPADCRACGIVDCAASGAACCAGVGAFAIDTEARNFAARNELVTAFDPASSGVSASFVFDAANQRGMIGFDLAGPTMIRTLEVITSSSGAARAPYVSLDTDEGASGCAYGLYFNAININDPVFCWGAFDFKLTTRVNVRIDSTTASAATLVVTSVRIN